MGLNVSLHICWISAARIRTNTHSHSRGLLRVCSWQRTATVGGGVGPQEPSVAVLFVALFLFLEGALPFESQEFKARNIPAPAITPPPSRSAPPPVPVRPRPSTDTPAVKKKSPSLPSSPIKATKEEEKALMCVQSWWTRMRPCRRTSKDHQNQQTQSGHPQLLRSSN